MSENSCVSCGGQVQGDARDRVIMRTSVLGIAVNIVLAAVKVGIGTLVSSIAIVSEGINNATDAVSSILTIVGTRLARKKPTEEHPFGFGRIEYLTSLIIATLIIVAAFQFLIESVKLIFHPETMTVSYVTLAIIAVSAVVKFVLGIYTIRVGRHVSSGALVAVGTECRSDSFVSVVTIVSSLVFLLSGVSIDAYAGVIMSLFILKAGIDVLWETVSHLLGKPSDKELADRIYEEVRKTPFVLNAADMMLHNYGPDAYSGSVNIEIDHAKNIGEVYEIMHELQLRIMHQMHVTMVFGIYAVDRDHQEVAALRDAIGEFVASREHVKSYHALFLPPGKKQVYCDLVVDYKLPDRKALKADFLELVRKVYPDYEVELVIETEYV